jgi:hypothetical protein
LEAEPSVRLLSTQNRISQPVRPAVFEGMFMAIAFSHEKRLANMRKAIEELRMEMNSEKQ